MPRFSEEFLNTIFEVCDIEQVIAPYTQLKRRGKNLVGLCPFHNERTPSFTVYPENHSYYCFGCGAAGTAIQFVQQAENLDFQEAVKALCDRYSIAMPADAGDDSLTVKRRRMIELNKEAARFFHTQLLSDQGREALEYLLSRGYSMATIKHFGMGFAPNDWRQLLNHLKGNGYSYEEIYEADLSRRSEKDGKVNYYDNFRNRVMVPIINVRGQVIAFGGRVLDDTKPKYINTSDTLVYKKSHGVFALNFAKNSKEKSLILVEGYMDVIALHQAGFTNAIACLGTALTVEMAHLISRYCEEVIICYDADEAGQKATNRAIGIFDSIGMKMRVVKLSGGKDPDEILKNHGSERFKSLIEDSSNELEFELNRIAERFDLNSDDGRLKYLSEACELLASQRNSLAASVYASRIAEQVDVNKETVQRRVDAIRSWKMRKKRAEEQTKQLTDATGKLRRIPASPATAKQQKAQERIIAILMKNPDFAPLCNELSEKAFIDPELRVIYSLLKSRIDEGKSVEEGFMAMFLSKEQYEHFARIMRRDEGLFAGKEELNECIGALKTDETNAIDLTKLSKEEFKQLFEKKKGK